MLEKQQIGQPRPDLVKLLRRVCFDAMPRNKSSEHLLTYNEKLIVVNERKLKTFARHKQPSNLINCAVNAAFFHLSILCVVEHLMIAEKSNRKCGNLLLSVRQFGKV